MVNEDDALLALPRSKLVCVECGRIDRGEHGWTLRLDIDDELAAFCQDSARRCVAASVDRRNSRPRLGGCHTWRAVVDQLQAAVEALNQGDAVPFASLFSEDAEWRGVSRGFLWWKHAPS